MGKKTPQERGRIYEADIARRTGGKTTPFSGAGVVKEDVIDGDWLVQAKLTDKESYSLKRSILDELALNAVRQGKIPRLEVSINGKTYVVLEEKYFDRMRSED